MVSMPEKTQEKWIEKKKRASERLSAEPVPRFTHTPPAEHAPAALLQAGFWGRLVPKRPGGWSNQAEDSTLPACQVTASKANFTMA